MSITEYNGSGVVVMTGKNCVAIASDKRFGVQQQSVSQDLQRIFKIHDKLFVGMPGLVTDVQTLMQKFNFRVKLYELREERKIKPSVFTNMLSAVLYEARFGPWFVEPLVCGLEDKRDEKTGVVTKNVPFIAATDLIGAGVTSSEWLVGGTAAHELYGTCEAFYKKRFGTGRFI